MRCACGAASPAPAAAAARRCSPPATGVARVAARGRRRVMCPACSQACRRLREYCGNRRASAWSSRRPPSSRGTVALIGAAQACVPVVVAVTLDPCYNSVLHASQCTFYRRSSPPCWRGGCGCSAARPTTRPPAGRRSGSTARPRTRWRAGTGRKAIKYLEKLEARYPYGRFAQQAQLEIAYCHWKDNERASAVAAADRFIKLYPNHPNVDYAWYLKGLVNFNEPDGMLSRARPRRT